MAATRAAASNDESPSSSAAASPDHNNLAATHSSLFPQRLFKSFHQHYPSGFLRKVLAEVIATYLLVFVTCGAAAISSADEHRVSKLGASVAGGLIVTVMIYAVGHISGAHMNPAVTTAFAAVRHFPWKQVPFYAAAQVGGAISASFTLRVLLHPIKNVGTTSPSDSEFRALVMEIVVTFSMMFVTSAVATDTKAARTTSHHQPHHKPLYIPFVGRITFQIGELAGIAVGSAVCITSILAGPISGGSMNPARTLGPALASSHYKGLWVYVVGPVTGTMLGALSYNCIKMADNKPLQVLPAISPRSFSLKLRRMRSDDAPNRDPFEDL